MASLVATLAAILAIAGGASGSEHPVASLDALAGRTIAIDPGHNGGNASHPSAINRLVPAGGFRKACDTTGTATSDERLSEAAFTWDVAKRLRTLLRSAGAEVVMTRSSNSGVGPCINRRAQIANRAHADLAISIHADGGPAGGRGFHVIRPGYLRGYTGSIVRPSKSLALRVRSALDRAGLRRADYIARNGLDRRTDLGGLNLSKVPKVMVELGNMRNGGDAAKLKRAAWRQKVARALRSALAAELGAGQGLKARA